MGKRLYMCKKKMSLFLFLHVLLSVKIFTQEYRISAIREYHVYDDLKYIQTIETYNYSEDNLLLSQTTYKFHPEEGFFFQNRTIYRYNDDNILLEEEYLVRENESTSKHYKYDSDGKLLETYFRDANEIYISSFVWYKYEDQKIIASGFGRKRYYDQYWNLILVEDYNNTGKGEKLNRYVKYLFEGNLLRKIEQYEITNDIEELMLLTDFIYNDINQLIKKETYAKHNDEMHWYSSEIFTYNSIGKIATEISYFNYDFNPVYFEINEKERYTIVEYEYQKIN
ncbi:hypothetical protein [Breznakiella homolactica]|uniref:Uncharacterized protein n=1 Tax=Breznakiella homolactica TaxID=2798577 RepID=A0A7T8BC90_9SPIR|nr:hypothetical protein [Breznakiella homolactica]QQO10895.1 hypothetical protein JFL75_08255 [Breznakiella homolactica]